MQVRFLERALLLPLVYCGGGAITSGERLQENLVVILPSLQGRREATPPQPLKRAPSNGHREPLGYTPPLPVRYTANFHPKAVFPLVAGVLSLSTTYHRVQSARRLSVGPHYCASNVSPFFVITLYGSLAYLSERKGHPILPPPPSLR